MAQLVFRRGAREEFARLRFTHQLPPDGWQRVLRSAEHLRFAPLAGQALDGEWGGFRYVVGPWDWMLIVYRYDEENDRAVVVLLADVRSGSMPLT